VRQSSRKDHAEEIKALEEELARRQEDYDQLKLEIRRQSPEYSALVYPEPMKWEQARQLLDEKTALLEYVLGREQSYLFVLTHDQFAGYPLGPREGIEQRVKQFNQLLAPGPLTPRNVAYLAEGYRLYQELIQPAEARLQGKAALIIVPDGNLALLPFATLLTS